MNTPALITALAAIVVIAVVIFLLRQEQKEQVSAEDLQKRIDQGERILLVDVRSAQEYADGHIPDAILLPHKGLPDSMNEISTQHDQVIVLYCERGPRALLAQNALTGAGFLSVLHLEGDMSGWRANGLPVEK